MKLRFMIYLVATVIVVTCLGEFAHELKISGDNRADIFYCLSLLALIIGALLTLRRAFIDEIIKN